MIVQVSQMVGDVRCAVDMNVRSTPLLAEGDLDSLGFEAIVRSKLVDAVRMVEEEAPLLMLEQGHNLPCEVTWTGNGKGWLLLPDDFMRLVAFRMSGWARAVHEAIGADDARYALQQSAWKGVCGNPERPVVAIVNRAEGRALEFYSCEDEKATVEQGAYLPYPCIDADGGIDVSRLCYRAAVLRAGALALATIGSERANALMEMSKGMMLSVRY